MCFFSDRFFSGNKHIRFSSRAVVFWWLLRIKARAKVSFVDCRAVTWNKPTMCIGPSKESHRVLPSVDPELHGFGIAYSGGVTFFMNIYLQRYRIQSVSTEPLL